MNPTKSANGRLRVLVVEDELLVRMFAVDALEDAGFDVEQAGTAGEAISSLKQLRGELHAVIVDLGLPDRSGDELAVDLRTINAEVPIVIASGRTEREMRERFASDSSVAVLAKPYTASMLVDALASVGVKN